MLLKAHILYTEDEYENVNENFYSHNSTTATTIETTTTPGWYFCLHHNVPERSIRV